MRNKLNCYERKDGQKWKDYINYEIQTKGSWNEMRYGDKYFKNDAYQPGCLVDITVGKDSATAETVLTLILESKELVQIKDVPKEFMHGTLDNLIDELEESYKKKVSMEDKVTLLKLGEDIPSSRQSSRRSFYDDDTPCGCPPV